MMAQVVWAPVYEGTVHGHRVVVGDWRVRGA